MIKKYYDFGTPLISLHFLRKVPVPNIRKCQHRQHVVIYMMMGTMSTSLPRGRKDNHSRNTRIYITKRRMHGLLLHVHDTSHVNNAGKNDCYIRLSRKRTNNYWKQSMTLFVAKYRWYLVYLHQQLVLKVLIIKKERKLFFSGTIISNCNWIDCSHTLIRQLYWMPPFLWGQISDAFR